MGYFNGARTMKNFLLTDELYDVANRIVGRVGESTVGKEKRYSVTGEDYVEFAMYFTDKNKVLPIWEKWIKAYKDFAKYTFPSYEYKIYDGKPLAIYWRALPDVREYDNKPGTYILYARLLISCRGKATSLPPRLYHR